MSYQFTSGLLIDRAITCQFPLYIKIMFSGALVNAVFLVALCFSITMESLKRFYEPEDIHDPKLILTVGALGLIVNLLGTNYYVH